MHLLFLSYDFLRWFAYGAALRLPLLETKIHFQFYLKLMEQPHLLLHAKGLLVVHVFLLRAQKCQHKLHEALYMSQPYLIFYSSFSFLGD